VDPGSHTVYVTKDGDKAVSVIDGATRTVTDTISGLGSVGAIAVDPDNRLIYVANDEDNTLSVVDGKGARPTYAVIDTVAVGKRPTDVAVDSGTHTVYVVGEGRLSVIDGPTRTVTATIGVNSASGHSLAVDSVTHTVYVTNTADGTVSVIERR
jgi:YVTN family beta-propeller protein